MADLISRAAAIETATDWKIKPDGEIFAAIKIAIRSKIEQLPAVDAVPVVRCGDCEHSYFASNRTPDEQCWVCGKHGIDVTPEWYCADGERRDDDGEDA